MFYHFIYPLKEYFSFLNIFKYITVRGMLAGLISLAVFYFFGKKFIEFIKQKVSGKIRKYTPENHNKKIGTPSMGGILIVIAVIISIIFAGNFHQTRVLEITITFFIFGIIGFIDDYLKEIKKINTGLLPRYKFLMQTIASLLFMLWVYYTKDNLTTKIFFPFLSDFSIDLGLLYIPFGMLIIIGSSNAVNITDGLDGLAIGLTIIVTIAMVIIAYLSGHKLIAAYLKINYIKDASEIAVISAALAGAAVGFLWFNSHPAQVFMGDTGSISIGALLGIISILIKQEILLIILGGVFVMETISVIIQVVSFKLRKKRIFKMAPVHHHFELKGWKESKIIIRFWIIGGILAIIALSTLKIR